MEVYVINGSLMSRYILYLLTGGVRERILYRKVRDVDE